MKQPHIKMEKVDPVVLLSGNPDRVHRISSFLKNPELQSEYRGLVSYKGYTSTDVPVTVLTTGMGTPSTAIVIEEAYRAGGRNFIRIGSCGALNSGNPNGTIFIPHGAIRDEGTSRRFVPIEYPAIADIDITRFLRDAADNLSIPYSGGLVVSTDIYYEDDMTNILKWAEFGATCVEMESSLLFAYQSIRNKFRAATILAADGNLVEQTSKYEGDVEQNYKIFDKAVTNTINITLQAINTHKDFFI